MEKNKKKILVMICAVVALVVVGTTYAFVTRTLTGTKKVTITAGTLSLVLNEGNAITISDALPMYDQVGMIQEDVFEFDLINNTSNPTDYVLKLTKIASANELSTSDVKYYLTKEGVGEPALLSSLTDGIIDTGTIVGNDTIDYTLRLWIDSSVTSNEAISGKSLSYRIDVEASMIEEDNNNTLTFADELKEKVLPTTNNMFDYTSEGCIGDMETEELTCSVDATNGIYMLEDDDGPSYYYRGKVNNLVKFGAYKTDYYVYEYGYEDFGTYQFASLKSCQLFDERCSESNKVLKYKAGTPMYWKIIRVNGNGTIRMIYAGTTPDATTTEVGIGSSFYNAKYDDIKYASYIYDVDGEETSSVIKLALDNWYNSQLAETVFDSKIVEGKFCVDSSEYKYDESLSSNIGLDVYSFGVFRRNYTSMYGSGNANPTFKCLTTSEKFGGNYSLKVGLITADEVLTAGGQLGSNSSYYLYNGVANNNDGSFWTLSPGVLLQVPDNSGAIPSVINVDDNGSISMSAVFGDFEVVEGHPRGDIIRPVINLRADIVFKEGTDGSKERPYELAE